MKTHTYRERERERRERERERERERDFSKHNRRNSLRFDCLVAIKSDITRSGCSKLALSLVNFSCICAKMLSFLPKKM